MTSTSSAASEDPVTRPPDPIPLDYSPPARAADPATSLLVGIMGLLAGLFALPMLFFGVFGFVYTFLYSKRSNRSGDFGEALSFLVTGLFCAFVCVRRCRWSIRRPR